MYWLNVLVIKPENGRVATPPPACPPTTYTKPFQTMIQFITCNGILANANVHLLFFSNEGEAYIDIFPGMIGSF